MNTEVMSSAVESVYPIYTDGLTIKWQMVICDAIESCEHKVDKWDIKFTLNEFKVIEDSAFKTIELSGSEFNINWLKRQFLEIFEASFNKEFQGYKFKFI